MRLGKCRFFVLVLVAGSLHLTVAYSVYCDIYLSSSEFHDLHSVVWILRGTCAVNSCRVAPRNWKNLSTRTHSGESQHREMSAKGLVDAKSSGKKIIAQQHFKEETER